MPSSVVDCQGGAGARTSKVCFSLPVTAHALVDSAYQRSDLPKKIFLQAQLRLIFMPCNVRTDLLQFAHGSRA